jgi:trimeric autotransporter adhesin
MANITVSTDIDTLLRSADNAAARASIGADVRTDANGAFSAGDLGGNARGANAINIQGARSAVTQVASGENAVTIGSRATASDERAIALGYEASASAFGATASGTYANASSARATASGYDASATSDYATALGKSATASGNSGTASGYGATASGYYSTATGNLATASGIHSIASGSNANASGYGASAFGFVARTTQNNSSAFGHRVKSATANAQELGYWSNSSTRAGAVRVHGTGYVAISIPQTDTAFTDGGATAGSEADGTIFRKGLAFRVSTADHLIATYCKADGTIISRDLGNMN